jgi:hypothetical protein
MLNHNSCKWLTERGYSSSSLKVNANVQPKSLDTRLSKDDSVEDRVKAIVKSGISLNSLFYTIGPTFLSTDEIFMAFEYRKRLKEYEVAKRGAKVFLKKKELKEKAKRLLALKKLTYNAGKATAGLLEA